MAEAIGESAQGALAKRDKTPEVMGATAVGFLRFFPYFSDWPTAAPG
jgi:hypothetical protein